MSNFVLTFDSIVPVFLLILFGFFLYKRWVIDRKFAKASSIIIFRYILPVLVFQRIVSLEDFPPNLIPGIILFATVSTAVFFFMWMFTNALSNPVQGSLVQGSFRSNLAIVGFAIIQGAFGDAALDQAVVLLAVIMPLYNIGSIIILTRKQEKPQTIARIVQSILTNPLILAVIIAVPVSVFSLPIPRVIDRTLNIISALTLPFALIAVGASLRVDSLIQGRIYWIIACVVKLIILPLIMFGACVLFGIDSDLRAILVILSACPTAVISFAMAEKYEADYLLAGEIVSTSTAASVLTLTVWLLVLI